MAQQILFDLEHAPDFSESAFFKGASNAEGWHALFEKDWPQGILVLSGPPGCGKSHLGSIWASKNDAVILGGTDRFEASPAWHGHAIWLDNAAQADEFALFTLINLALQGKMVKLLLSDQKSPADWPVTLPDLQSRLRNLETVWIDDPDDDLLLTIMDKLFHDRGLKVSGTLPKFFLGHTDRSVKSVRELIIELDRAAAAAKVNVTRSFAATFLNSKMDT